MPTPSSAAAARQSCSAGAADVSSASSVLSASLHRSARSGGAPGGGSEGGADGGIVGGDGGCGDGGGGDGASRVATPAEAPAVSAERASAAEARVAKRKAIETLVHYQVFEDVPEEEAEALGLKFIKARWEDQQRPGAERKMRYVAQEFAWQEARDGCFAAASTAQTSRLIDFIALQEGWSVFGADCVKAYYQSDQLEKACKRARRLYSCNQSSLTNTTHGVLSTPFLC